MEERKGQREEGKGKKSEKGRNRKELEETARGREGHLGDTEGTKGEQRERDTQGERGKERDISRVRETERKEWKGMQRREGRKEGHTVYSPSMSCSHSSRSDWSMEKVREESRSTRMEGKEGTKDRCSEQTKGKKECMGWLSGIPLGGLRSSDRLSSADCTRVDSSILLRAVCSSANCVPSSMRGVRCTIFSTPGGLWCTSIVTWLATPRWIASELRFGRSPVPLSTFSDRVAPGWAGKRQESRVV